MVYLNTIETNWIGFSLASWFKKNGNEIEPAYRTGRHEESLTQWDDYNCDLLTAFRFHNLPRLIEVTAKRQL